MNLPELSVRRPIFITCIFLVILALGILSRGRLDVGLYPNVTFPVINIIVPFPGAGPEEVESQISKPIENALSALSGLRTLRSTSLDGAGVVTAVFGMGQDIRFAEQKVIQIMSSIRGNLPRDIMEPIIRTVDPTDTPVLVLSLTADLSEAELFDLADHDVRPLLEQIPQVGLVQLQGARKREIEVELIASKLRAHEMSGGEVVGRVGAGGRNIPAGSLQDEKALTPVRVLGQFDTLDQIRNTVVRFVGNESPILVSDIARVRDSLSDEANRVYVNGKRALTLKVFRQSGGNTVAVADAAMQRVKEINDELRARVKGFNLAVVHDGSRPVRESVKDASDAIEYGVLLTIVVVLVFLGNLRSTFITGIALPNSLFGAFLLMWAAGFTVNITTLAALSVSVGLLVDDAIVVRENIFRRLESGEPPLIAAVAGTREVTLAVVATTLTVLSVFGPIAFLQGLIGQFFKQFGLTICFAMLISLLDSLTMAPMLSAYFAGRMTGGVQRILSPLMTVSEKFQLAIERFYMRVLALTMRAPAVVLGLAAATFFASLVVFQHVPKIFLPPAEGGEFDVSLEMPPGTSLEAMDRMARAVDERLRRRPEIERIVITTGGENGETNNAELLVLLKRAALRAVSTNGMKDLVRQDLQAFKGVNSRLQDILDIGGGAGRPFMLILSGQDLGDLKRVSSEMVGYLKKSGDLKDVESNYRVGARELRLDFDRRRAQEYGMSSADVGQEMRILLAGISPARLEDRGRDYEVRVRLRPEDRDLRKTYPHLWVPNLNHRLVPLSAFTRLEEAESPAVILREDRRRFLQISGDIDPKGRGLAAAMQEARALVDSGKIALPPGVRFEYSGQTKDFQDLLGSMLLTLGLSLGSMYLVLASLYESFFVPFSIMLVLPLAVCGAFYALGLTHSPLDIYSIVGCILLLGVAAKNSILLVDYINEGLRAGKDRHAAILEAAKVRLRPILMTSFALIAGMLPVACPIEESAKQRAGMAVAVIGGIISSTLLTLIVIPAAYGFLERFQSWVMGYFRLLMTREAAEEA